MDELYHLPGHLIRRMQQRAVQAFVTEVQNSAADLTPVQFAALVSLARNPGIEQATLAALIGYDRVTIGGVIGRLESRGLLERRVSETDRRARSLQITAAGEALLTEVWPSVRRAQDSMLSGLDPAERETLIALLEKTLRATDDLER